MYTVEFEDTAAVIVSIDETATHQDIQVTIEDDNTVFIIQYDEVLDSNEVIQVSYQQLLDIMAALKSPEGAYYVRFLDAANTNKPKGIN